MAAQTFRTDSHIEEIIEKYQSMVYKIALTHTRNQSDADDVFQQTFLIYCSKNLLFHDEEHRKAWFIRTAINCSKKITFSSWRNKTVLLDEVPGESFQFTLEDENAVFIAIKELPEKYRTVIHLYYFEELSVKRISCILKIRAGTVRMQLLRGREMLREKLKGDYFDETSNIS